MIDHFRYVKEKSKVIAKFCIPSPSLAYHRGGKDLIDKKIKKAGMKEKTIDLFNTNDEVLL